METLKITETEDQLIIQISPPMKFIIRLGLAFQGFLYVSALIGLIILIIKTIDDMGFISLGLFILFVICFVIGRKYLNRAFYKEFIIATKTELIITEKFLFEKKNQKYLIENITNVSFIGQHKFTPNLITGSDVYSNGVRIGENEIQYLIEDGTIGFVYNGVTIRFAMNVPSWDAEYIISRIESFTGKTLKVDDRKEELLEEIHDKNTWIDTN